MHCKQAEPKNDGAFVFQDYNIQQVLEKQPGITCLTNIFFDSVSLFRSKTCPEQTSLYRPCLHLLSCHIRAFRVFSFAVFQPAFYDPSSLPQFSHIQCLPRSLQKSYSTYFGVQNTAKDTHCSMTVLGQRATLCL